jgi:hypothetical protein
LTVHYFFVQSIEVTVLRPAGCPQVGFEVEIHWTEFISGVNELAGCDAASRAGFSR